MGHFSLLEPFPRRRERVFAQAAIWSVSRTIRRLSPRDRRILARTSAHRFLELSLRMIEALHASEPPTPRILREGYQRRWLDTRSASDSSRRGNDLGFPAPRRRMPTEEAPHASGKAIEAKAISPDPADRGPDQNP
jgi:hypothetical protein